MAGSQWLKWLTVLVLATIASGCGEACDAEIMLQVEKASKVLGLNSKERAQVDKLNFRVIAVNKKRNRFFKLRRRKTVLAMGGGGTRAMSGVTGQLRALKAMNLLKEVDQAIATSGSTWAVVLFAYVQGFTIQELLGDETANSLGSLSLTAIRISNGKILEKAAAPTTPYVALAALLGEPANKGLEVGLAGAFLCEFGLNGKIPDFAQLNPSLCSDPGSKNQVWTTGQRRLDWIKQRNPDLNLSDALVMNGNLPSIILAGTLLSPVGYNPKGESVVATRFSPDFSGSPYYADQQNVDFEPWNASLPPLKDVVVGGGVVETFAFLSTLRPKTPFRRGGFVKAELEDQGILSLQEAMGISSSNLGILGVVAPDFVKEAIIDPLARQTGIDFTDDFDEDPYLFSPRRKYWPVTGYGKAANGDIEEKDYYVGDGASMESSSLLEGIRSGAKCAVVLINNLYPIEPVSTVDFCNAPPANPLALLATPLGARPGGPSIYDYFGVTLPTGAILQVGYEYSNNHVFPTLDLYSLMCEAQTLRAAGNATVVYRKLTTVKNKHWGIEAGRKIRVVFVWTEKTSKWEEQLPQETQDAINNGSFDSFNRSFGLGFPYVRTISPKPDASDFTALLPEQANLYASLTEWSLRQNQDKLEKCMGVASLVK